MKQFMKRPLTLTFLLLAVAALAFFLWRQSQTLSPEQRYKLQEAVVADLTQNVSANGTLSPVTLVNVGTQVSGTVSELLADFNDRVKRGQVLLKLDPVLLNAAVKQAGASLESARAQRAGGVASRFGAAATLDRDVTAHRRGRRGDRPHRTRRPCARRSPPRPQLRAVPGGRL